MAAPSDHHASQCLRTCNRGGDRQEEGGRKREDGWDLKPVSRMPTANYAATHCISSSTLVSPSLSLFRPPQQLFRCSLCQAACVRKQRQPHARPHGLRGMHGCPSSLLISGAHAPQSGSLAFTRINRVSEQECPAAWDPQSQLPSSPLLLPAPLVQSSYDDRQPLLATSTLLFHPDSL